jgi:hypothetical protein
MLSNEEHEELDKALSQHPNFSSPQLHDFETGSLILFLILTKAREAYDRHNDPLVIPSNLDTFLEANADLWQKLRYCHGERKYAEIREHRVLHFSLHLRLLVLIPAHT